MIKVILVMAAAQGSPFIPQGSAGHEFLMGLAGLVCGALLLYAILSQL